MATITIQEPGLDGIIALAQVTPTATTGDKFLNTGKELIFIKNGNASVCVVTVTCQTNSNYGTLVDSVTTVTALTGTGAIGPLPKARFDDNDGFVTFVCDIQTTVEACVIKGR